jgi:hypothetical protein
LAFKTHEIIDHIIYYLRNAAVKIESIDVAETIKTTKALIETENQNLDDNSIKNEIIENLRTPNDYVIVNYKRGVLNQPGGGHISPLGAYH